MYVREERGFLLKKIKQCNEKREEEEEEEGRKEKLWFIHAFV